MRKTYKTKKNNPEATYFGEVLASVHPKPWQKQKPTQKHEKIQ